jgi:hypothetical protein
MRHPRSSTHTKVVAVLGTDTLAESILSRLLEEEEGYDVRHLDASSYTTGEMEELLEGVDVVLVATGLKPQVREVFHKAMRANPKTHAIPVLALPEALNGALLDEYSVSASWRTLFEELIGQIRDALTRAAASAKALVEECRCIAEPPPSPAATQADTL